MVPTVSKPKPAMSVSSLTSVRECTDRMVTFAALDIQI